MKIILINPNPNLIMETTSVNLAPPMGLHVIGSFLMKNGYDIILIDTRMYSIEYVNDILKKTLTRHRLCRDECYDSTDK